jgi:Protein of unknown function (DUF2806)
MIEGESKETDDGGGGSSALSILEGTVGDLVTGIPAPIRKNAIKAFGRLCTAAVEYPVAMIENAIEEKRAESRAQVKLIEASASQIAKQMQTDPEYARAAASKFAQKIIRERVNVDQISKFAASDLRSEPQIAASGKEPEAPPITEDWLNAFETEATQMSSEQMQRLFGKILAGEIRRPTSYSIKTLKVMAQLDNRAATLFQQLCSLSISFRVTDPNTGQNIIVDARVVSMGPAGANSLQAYGLGFDALNLLQEYGLIISDYNTFFDYMMAFKREPNPILPMTYQNSQWIFIPGQHNESKALQIIGIGFSQTGKELLSIVDILKDDRYTDALKVYFAQRNVTLTKVE